MKRIVNTIDGRVPELSPEQALKLLRTRHIDENGIQPIREAKEALFLAFPEAVRVDETGGRRVNYRRLLDEVLLEFVPAFQAGGAPGRPGRPVIPKQDIVSIIDSFVQSGEAKSIAHACNVARSRGLFPGLRAVNKAYYRAKKLQINNTTPIELSQ